MKLEKVELTASVTHIEKFSDSEIPIYNFEVPDTASRKTTKRRRRRKKKSQTIAKR